MQEIDGRTQKWNPPVWRVPQTHIQSKKKKIISVFYFGGKTMKKLCFALDIGSSFPLVNNVAR